MKRNIPGEVSVTSDSGGVIDDAIVDRVLGSADERMNSSRMGRKTTVLVRVFGFLFGILLLCLLITESTNVKKGIKVNVMLKETGSAFEFTAPEDYSEIVYDETTDEIVTVTHIVEEETAPKEVLLANEDLPIREEINSRIQPPFEEEIPLLDKQMYPVAIDNILLDRFADIRAEGDMAELMPFFWQIPHVGSVFESVAVSCLHLIVASRYVGVIGAPQSIDYIQHKDKTYVSVDLTTKEGIDSAVSLGLPSSDLSYNSMVTPLLYHGAEHLLGQSKGRLFTLLRHPIERAIQVYYSFISSTSDPELETMSLVQYASSRHAEENWMVRRMTNKLQIEGKDVNEMDLLKAKEILRQKCIIGLYSKMDESISRFEKTFGWGAVTENQANSGKICHNQILDNVRQRDKTMALGTLIQKGDIAYNLLLNKNKLDMDLYLYAVRLYAAQKELFTS